MSQADIDRIRQLARELNHWDKGPLEISRALLATLEEIEARPPAHCEGCGNDDGPSWCKGVQ